MHECHICGSKADVEVVLYDVYYYGDIFFERDYTCPFLCFKHMVENERSCRNKGDQVIAENIHGLAFNQYRRARGDFHYKHSNQHGAQGFTIYRPIE